MTIHHTDPSAAQDPDHLTAKVMKGGPWRKFNDTIRVSGINAGDLDISFQRTIRVADNQGHNLLPPSMGTFPLYSVANYYETLPEDMASKGGIFFPMYREFPFTSLHGSLAHATSV